MYFIFNLKFLIHYQEFAFNSILHHWWSKFLVFSTDWKFCGHYIVIFASLSFNCCQNWRLVIQIDVSENWRLSKLTFIRIDVCLNLRLSILWSVRIDDSEQATDRFSSVYFFFNVILVTKIIYFSLFISIEPIAYNRPFVNWLSSHRSVHWSRKIQRR